MNIKLDYLSKGQILKLISTPSFSTKFVMYILCLDSREYIMSELIIKLAICANGCIQMPANGRSMYSHVAPACNAIWGGNNPRFRAARNDAHQTRSDPLCLWARIVAARRVTGCL